MAKQHTMERIFEMLPRLDMDKLKAWIRDDLFRKVNYATVSSAKEGYTAECLYCGERFSLRELKSGSAQHNTSGICPKCGRVITFKDEWRGHKTLIDYGYFLVVQKMRNKALMLRSFYVRRSYGKEWDERLELSEHMRVYVHPDGIRTFVRKLYSVYGMDYFFIDEYSSCEYWIEHKSVGKPVPYNYFQSSINYILGIKWETDLSKTLFKYSCAEEFMRSIDSYYPPDLTKYLELYMKYPVLTERLFKEGFVNLLKDKINGCLPMQMVNFRKKTVSEAFGVPRSAVKELKGCDQRILMQKKIEIKYHITDTKDIDYLNYLNTYTLGQVDYILKKMTVRKLRTYLDKQREKRVHLTPMGDYYDYLHECEKLKLDLSKKFILFPEDLRKAHEDTSRAIREIKAQKEAEAIAERDRAFAVKLKTLEKKYSFSADGLLIRPAKGAGELIKEGASLNHCVATYSDKYLNGQTIILFIRREAAPDESYYTMELSPTSETVIQCRGLRNCGKTPEIEEFIRKWDEWRSNKKNKKKAVTAA